VSSLPDPAQATTDHARTHQRGTADPMTERHPHDRSVPPEVEAYIAGVPADQRALFERLHRLVLDTLPEARVTISYNMPAYVVDGGRVSLSSGQAGVSIATTVPEPIAAFKAKHQQFKTGKVTVQLPSDAELPEDDLRALVREATGHAG
jgi:uncharacterized protein YdhG (YjbR/CyaY superfamily)